MSKKVDVQAELQAALIHLERAQAHSVNDKQAHAIDISASYARRAINVGAMLFLEDGDEPTQQVRPRPFRDELRS